MNNYEPALPDENRAKVLPDVVVAGGSPNWSDGQTIEPIKDQDSGTMRTGQKIPDYAVPGLPHYGVDDGFEDAGK